MAIKQKSHPKIHNFLDLTGHKYGRLTALYYAGKNKNGRSVWFCRCDCGKETVKESAKMRNGDSKSCGCYALEKRIENGRKVCTKHSKYGTKIYHTWQSMLDRCRNPNHKFADLYINRGIKVCDRWLQFENFYADMGEPPSPKHSIDRIDNNGNYCLENCRWATQTEQNNNRSNTKFVTYKGKTKPLGEWCRELNLKHGRTFKRIFKLGWRIEDAFTKPIACNEVIAPF